HLRQHHVQDRKIVLALFRALQASLAVVHGLRRKPLDRQVFGNEFAKLFVVVDYQHIAHSYEMDFTPKQLPMLSVLQFFTLHHEIHTVAVSAKTSNCITTAILPPNEDRTTENRNEKDHGNFFGYRDHRDRRHFRHRTDRRHRQWRYGKALG